MKKMLGLVLAALAPAAAVAQYSDGPFADVAALNAYWTGTSTSSSLTQIYVDGTKVFQRSGFGPGFVKQYFLCYYTNDIRVNCGSQIDGTLDLSALVASMPANAPIYLDNVLYRSGIGSGNIYIETCVGDQSYYGPVEFYEMTGYYFGPGPHYNGSCP